MSDLGLYWLPMSHKKDDRLIWVNTTFQKHKSFYTWNLCLSMESELQGHEKIDGMPTFG